VTDPPDVLEAGETVPHAIPVQLEPESDQFTPLFDESFCKVAANVWVPPTATLAIDGATTTEIPDVFDPDVSVIVAFADFVVSSTAVAVSITVGGLGTVAGAVYITAVPDAAVVPESVPQAAEVQPAPDSVQVVP
jgi:hypothetical protein